MKGFAMLGLGSTGWIEKDCPVCAPLDAICRPIAVAPCTSDIHTVWEGAIGERHDMILGHESVGLMSVAGAAIRGASHIYAVGSRPNCVQIAKEYAATDIMNYKQGDIVKQVILAVI